jgi:hypothetical protein
MPGLRSAGDWSNQQQQQQQQQQAAERERPG